jgi:hypothetical protein
MSPGTEGGLNTWKASWKTRGREVAPVATSNEGAGASTAGSGDPLI